MESLRLGIGVWLVFVPFLVFKTLLCCSASAATAKYTGNSTTVCCGFTNYCFGIRYINTVWLSPCC